MCSLLPSSGLFQELLEVLLLVLESVHVLQSAHVGERLSHRLWVARIAPQRGHGPVQQLVDDPLAEVLQDPPLLLGETLPHLVKSLVELALANVLGLGPPC